ncbi:unnamed protein product [Blepharisma stoltei]|uniref:Kinesin motor domain-containing protein n=1 Tax=Blepharisma stoltei TaxID=1481888 RepID=A0AAU9K316_9CILI|nr:unnamed protein product [Blepharisma stoltei]
MDSKAGHIKVAIRIRPLLDMDINSALTFTIDDNKSIKVNYEDQEISGTYDIIFSPKATQDTIFEFIEPVLQDTLKGSNLTVFTYGQTGSGKTYTMFGNDWECTTYSQLSRCTHNQNEYATNRIGMIPRSISSLFNEFENSSASFSSSFLQIYNEHIYDLLRDPKRDTALKIREDKVHGIFIEGLSEFEVETEEECLILLSKGNRHKAIRQTRMNQSSSRSHTIFQIFIENNQSDSLRRNKINFCDLAGSEKYDKENSMAEEHINELKQINKSLSALGQVIHALASKNVSHIPYRNSKLTRLLQDSLEGNSKTVLIATISPSAENFEETISTLTFADRAKEVMIKSKKNTNNLDQALMIDHLKREIEKLKNNFSAQQQVDDLFEMRKKIKELKEENEQLKQMADMYRNSEKARYKAKSTLEMTDTRETISPSPDLEGSPVLIEGFNTPMPGMTSPGRSPTFSQKSEQYLQPFCPVCKITLPCIHYSLSPRIQINQSSDLSQVPSSTTLETDRNLDLKPPPNHPNRRQPSDTNLYIEENEEELEKTMHQVSAINNRITRLEEFENEKKLQIRREIEKMEYEKRKEIELRMIKEAETRKRREILREKKLKEAMRRKKIDEAKKLEEIKRFQELAKIEDIKKQAEAMRKKAEEEKKKQIEEFNRSRKIAKIKVTAANGGWSIV